MEKIINEIHSYLRCIIPDKEKADAILLKAEKAIQVAYRKGCESTLPRWTTEMPTSPGWYWVESATPYDDEPSILYVAKENGALCIWGHCVDCYKTRWAGPIEPPSEESSC